MISTNTNTSWYTVILKQREKNIHIKNVIYTKQTQNKNQIFTKRIKTI